MTLISLIQNLEAELKKAEKLARHYDSHTDSLREKLTEVADALGKSLGVTTVVTEASGVKKATVGKRHRTISKAHKKAIAKAQRARWARVRAGKKGK